MLGSCAMCGLFRMDVLPCATCHAWLCAGCMPGHANTSHAFSEEEYFEVEGATWNFNHFAAIGPDKLKAIRELFAMNPALDFLVLQEVNDIKTLWPLHDEFDIYPGVHMASLTVLDKPPKKKNGASFELQTDGGKFWVRPTQHEYYPLLVRKGSGITTTASSAWPERPLGKRDIYYWSKPPESRSPPVKGQKAAQLKALNDAGYPPYRPVVQFTLQIRGRTVEVGIVHTSPEGQGLNRGDELAQIDGYLRHVAAQQDDRPWLILGDYYLDPEAHVTGQRAGLDDLFRSYVESKGLSFAVTLSATNQSVITLEHDGGIPPTGGPARWRPDYDRGRRVVDKRADFALTKGFRFSQALNAHPRGGGLFTDPEHAALDAWRTLSDHAPVLVFGSMGASSRKFFAALHQAALRFDVARDKALLNQQAALGMIWAELKLMMDNIQHLNPNERLVVWFMAAHFADLFALYDFDALPLTGEQRALANPVTSGMVFDFLQHRAPFFLIQFRRLSYGLYHFELSYREDNTALPGRASQGEIIQGNLNAQAFMALTNPAPAVAPATTTTTTTTTPTPQSSTHVLIAGHSPPTSSRQPRKRQRTGSNNSKTNTHMN